MDIPSIFEQVRQDCVFLWQKGVKILNLSQEDKKIVFAAVRVFLALASAFACLVTLRLLFRTVTIVSCMIAPAISMLIFCIKHDIFVIFKNDSNPTHQKIADVGKEVREEGKKCMKKDKKEKKMTKAASHHPLSEGTFAPYIWNYILQSNPGYWKSVFSSLIEINEK